MSLSSCGCCKIEHWYDEKTIFVYKSVSNKKYERFLLENAIYKTVSHVLACMHSWFKLKQGRLVILALMCNAFSGQNKFCTNCSIYNKNHTYERMLVTFSIKILYSQSNHRSDFAD